VQELEHYERLARDRPFLAAVLAVGVGSLAGIPPLAGFMGKLLLFIAAFQAHLTWLLGVAILGVVLSIFYYFGWIKAAFFESWRPTSTAEIPAGRLASLAPSWFSTAILSALALATLLLGFYPGPLTGWLVK
jgi:NADH-quinone oxidoreductase subunit N